MQISSKIAVVTGGAGGIGEAAATKLAEAGARVITWDWADGADIKVDVRDEASIDAALDATIERAGVPEIVVISAGINARSPFEETSLVDFDNVVAVNLRGAYACMQAIVREMKKARSGGSFVLLASLAGMLADPQTVPYSVSKAGLIHLAKLAAVELGQFGIRVNSVSPGPIYTKMTARNLDDPAYHERVRQTTPLGDYGTPEHVADAILALTSLDWVTGQNLAVDGGSSLVTPRGAHRASLGTFHAGESYVDAPKP
jgi:NAD(P)-dependent dehydrogenase (short-subunit alcohol dehydrogenase family)